MIKRTYRPVVLIALFGLTAGLVVPWPTLRVGLGLLFVLFVPGYALQAVLFPQPRLQDVAHAQKGASPDTLERLALALGLSVAVIPIFMFLVELSRWRINLLSVVVGEGVLMIVCGALAWTRRAHLPAGRRALDVASMGLSTRRIQSGQSRDREGGLIGRFVMWWRAQDRVNRTLLVVLAGAVGVAVLAVSQLFVNVPVGDAPFTEFYVLGAEGTASAYPRVVSAGQPVTVTLGVHNHELTPVQYRVVVLEEGQPVGEVASFQLAPDETREFALDFVPVRGRDIDVEMYDARHPVGVQFLLYREGVELPYRKLQLWLSIVKEAAL